MKFKNLFFRVITGLICITIPFLSGAQTATIPAFKMQLTNGKIVTSAQLDHQKPTVLIYFAPDCEHCQVLMNEIFSRFNDFKTTQMVMVTFEPVKELFAFEKKYQTAKYANIKVGSELPVFFFRYFYKLEHTPFTALFDKNGKLVASYKDQTPVNDLVRKLKSLH